MEADQRARLLVAKLRAVIADASGATVEPTPIGGGAAALVGDHAWVLADESAGTRILAGALVWAVRQEAARLSIVVDDPTVAGVLARRAPEFTLSSTIHRLDGRTLRDAAPAARGDSPPLSAEVEGFVADIVAAGADAVVEHGVLTAEVDGLEVARAIVDDGGARLEIGVGHHDRLAGSMVHGGESTAEGLARIVAAVRTHRVAGGPTHPLQDLAPERRLRRRLIDEPALVGAVELHPVAPVDPADNLIERQPAAAVGTRAGGEEIVVVCSAGVDLDLVPTAADLRQREAPEADLVLAVSPSGDHPITRLLAAALRQPASVVVIDPPVA